MMFKSNSIYTAWNKSIFTLFSLRSSGKMYEVLYESHSSPMFTTNYAKAFILLIYRFNIQLIYRFSKCLSAKNE